MISRFPLSSLATKVRKRAGTASRAALHAVSQMLRESGILPSHTDYTPFIIYGMARTGTTMLVSFLQSHPNCVCYSELFHPHDPKWFTKKMNFLQKYRSTNRSDLENFMEENVYNEKSKSKLAVGFKVLYGHLSNPSSSCFESNDKIKDLIRNVKEKECKVVHIKRRNKIKRAVSSMLADKRKKWQSTKEPPEDNIKVELPKNVLERVIKYTEEREKKSIKKLDSLDIIDIKYENIIKDNKELEKVQRFLGLPVVSLSTETARMRRRPLREVVKNFEEVKEELRGTGYEHLLK